MPLRKAKLPQVSQSLLYDKHSFRRVGLKHTHSACAVCSCVSYLRYIENLQITHFFIFCWSTIRIYEAMKIHIQKHSDSTLVLSHINLKSFTQASTTSRRKLIPNNQVKDLSISEYIQNATAIKKQLFTSKLNI